MDHVIPEVAGGETVVSNLALACVHCSLRKGARVAASDPKTGVLVRLFHPRQQEWNSHFRWNGTLLAGVSATGRATIHALGLNSPEHRIIRSIEALLDRHPPPGHA